MSKFNPLHIANLQVYLPVPASISHFYSFGSLLGVTLSSQILTGLLLAVSYSPTMLVSFDSVLLLSSDSSYGWLFRTLHANGASCLFLFIYAHVGRGLYFNSFRLKLTWLNGVVLLFLFIGVSFLGYVLP